MTVRRSAIIYIAVKASKISDARSDRRQGFKQNPLGPEYSFSSKARQEKGRFFA